MPTSATNEMLDAFRYNRFAEVAFAEVAFAEKCRKKPPICTNESLFAIDDRGLTNSLVWP